MAPRAMRILFTADDIEAALESLPPPGARDEGTVMLAALALVRLLRGGSVNGRYLQDPEGSEVEPPAPAITRLPMPNESGQQYVASQSGDYESAPELEALLEVEAPASELEDPTPFHGSYLW